MKRTSIVLFVTQAVLSGCLFLAPMIAAQEDSARRQLSAKELWQKKDPREAISSLAFSGDGSLLVGDIPGAGIRIWKAKDSAEVRTLNKDTDGSRQVVIHPKRPWVLQLPPALGRGKVATLWNLETGRIVWEMTPYSTWCRAAAFCPDGNLLVSSGLERGLASLKGWDAETGEAKWTFPTPDLITWQLAFSPDGRTLAYRATPKVVTLGEPRIDEVVLIDVVKREEIRRFKAFKSIVHNVAWIWFTADGKRLITADRPQTIRIWDVATGECLETLPIVGEDDLNDVSYSPAANLLAGTYGEKSSSALLWRPGETGDSVRVLDLKDGPGQIALSRDGTLLARGGVDGFGVWRLEEFEDKDPSPKADPDEPSVPKKVRPALKARELWELQAPKVSRLHALAFDPKRERLAVVRSERLISFWNARDGKRLGGFNAGAPTTDLLFHPTGDRLASGRVQVSVRDIPMDKELWTGSTRFDQGLALASSPDGKLLATGTMARPRPLKKFDLGGGFARGDLSIAEIKLLDWETGKVERTLLKKDGHVRQLAFSGDGKWLAAWTAPRRMSSPSDTYVHVWEVATGRRKDDLKMPARGAAVPLLWVNEDGTRIITGARGQAFEVWNAEIWESLKRMAKVENAHLSSFAITPDGRRLAAAYSEVFNRVVIWDPINGQKLLTLGEPEPITHLAFSGDGKLLAYGNDKRVKVLELTAPGP